MLGGFLLVAPPPKAVASRRAGGAAATASAASLLTNGKSSSIGNGTGTGSGSILSDPFGLDPFEIGVIEADSIFQKTQPLSKISVDDFTLESLDPLRK